MSLAELIETMTLEEYREWQAYFRLEVEDMRERMSEQRADMRAKRGYHR